MPTDLGNGERQHLSDGECFQAKLPNANFLWSLHFQYAMCLIYNLIYTVCACVYIKAQNNTFVLRNGSNYHHMSKLSRGYVIR